MSVQQQALVWGLSLKHNEAWVLMCLADASHPDGSEAYPGVPFIAWATGYEERQVRRVLKRLRDMGVIEVVSFAHGGQRPTKYQLHLDRADKKPPLVREVATPDKMSGTPDTAMTATPDTAMSPEPSVTIIEPPEEPSVYKGSWRRTLRAIEGWDKKGEPHMASLEVWIDEKGWLKDQLEASAIGLAATSEKTLKGYRDMAAAFQRRLNQGYDDPTRRNGLDGRGAGAVPAGPGGTQGEASSGWDNRGG